ncbi:MAG TPA: hypothetical protein VKF37_03520, partial [Chloroflexota bacterium]|nr:hypothetical protein [Chloroflexota bacterium]
MPPPDLEVLPGLCGTGQQVVLPEDGPPLRRHFIQRGVAQPHAGPLLAQPRQRSAHADAIGPVRPQVGPVDQRQGRLPVWSGDRLGEEQGILVVQGAQREAVERGQAYRPQALP